jgi:amino acid permease
MKKINFKQKKYVLPLLALPFFFFVYVGAQFTKKIHLKRQPKELSLSLGETQDSIMTKNDAYDAFSKKMTTERCWRDWIKKKIAYKL